MISRNKYSLEKETIIAKANLFKAMRNFLEGESFVEVHTPILHHRPDYPIDSHYSIIENHTITYLRICMELRLRQILSTGLKCVYEIGPCFRKEKVPEKPHEFYMMECFKESITFDELILLTEKICKHCAKSINIKLPNGRWPLISINQLFTVEEIQNMKIGSKNIPSFIELFDTTHNNKLKQINERIFFIIDYPVETMSLASRKGNHSNIIERFELFINGIEVAHGFVDSIDYEDVRGRMKEIGWIDEPLSQLLKNKKIPPSGGVGIGMERLFQALCGIEGRTPSINEIIIPEDIELVRRNNDGKG
ncbi:MAG: hypothetical protein H8D45_13320 [Bacteroidetes bacterium]|nr:hypothetical protein [Bacteroidota bacterium]